MENDLQALVRELVTRGIHLYYENGKITLRSTRIKIDDTIKDKVTAWANSLKDFCVDGEFDGNCVVPVNHGRFKNFLFCPHAIDGNAVVYARLANYLNDYVSVYAFDNQALLKKPIKPLTVIEMARRYVKWMRVVQPQGPYHLFGFSSGGLIVLEMARILLCMGERVGLIGLGDTRFLSVGERAPRTTYGSTDNFAWSTFSQLFFSYPTFRYLNNTLLPNSEFRNLSDNDKLRMLIDLDNADRNDPLDFDLLDYLLHNYRQYLRNYYTFVPKPFAGKVTYFRVSGCHPPVHSKIVALAEHGWETLDIPGKDHMQVIRAPGVQLVSDVIKRYAYIDK